MKDFTLLKEEDQMPIGQMLSDFWFTLEFVV